MNAKSKLVISCLGTIFLSIFIVRGSDLILVPANQKANEQYKAMHSGDIIQINGQSYVLEDLEQRTKYTEGIFEKYIVPRIEYNKASLKEVLDFLQSGVIDEYMQLTEKSFVFFSIRTDVPNVKVTLQVKHTKLKEALDELAQQASCHIRISGSQILLERNKNAHHQDQK